MEQGALKNEDCQDYLADLASIPQISFIISVDHIASTRLWNEKHLDQFNFYSM